MQGEETGRRPLDVGVQRPAPLAMFHLTGDRGRATDADGTPPVVERIQHIRLAELDPHWTASRSLRLVPLAAAIDAAERNLERDPAFSPRAHLFESRPDDPDQMPLV